MVRIYPGHCSVTFTHIYDHSKFQCIHMNILIRDFQCRAILTIYKDPFQYIPYIELDKHLDIFPLSEIQTAIIHVIDDLKSGFLVLNSHMILENCY